MAVTRIKNNQITDSTITFQKIASGTLVGSLFNANLTFNSNININGNLSIAGGPVGALIRNNPGNIQTGETGTFYDEETQAVDAKLKDIAQRLLNVTSVQIPSSQPTTDMWILDSYAANNFYLTPSSTTNKKWIVLKTLLGNSSSFLRMKKKKYQYQK